MSHADEIRTLADAATNGYVGELLAAAQQDAERRLEQVQTWHAEQVNALNGTIQGLEAQVAELEGRQCPDPGAHEPVVEPSPWTLLEDVDLSDPTGWRLETGRPNNAEGYDLPRNVEFGPDGLRLWGRREQYVAGGVTHQYTAADARGEGHPIPNYCRVEVTGRGPAARGLWPCVLWLRPLSGSDGEIDLMENFGGQPRVSATLHDAYGDGHDMIPAHVPWRELANPDPAALHTYVMEKTPGRILITVDERTILDVGPAVANPIVANPSRPIPPGFDWQQTFERDRQWYPRVTMQVSSPDRATGAPDPSFTSADMLVTSLRIFELNQ